MRKGPIITGIVGATAGLLYWSYIGCLGSCGVWSSVWSSTGVGAVMGYLLFDVFADIFFKKVKEPNP
jgi:hypothetical protein